MALNPLDFINSTRLSSARSYAAAPNGPLSWCIHPPFSKVDAPFNKNPESTENEIVLIPKGSVTLSINSVPS